MRIFLTKIEYQLNKHTIKCIIYYINIHNNNNSILDIVRFNVNIYVLYIICIDPDNYIGYWPLGID